jgi:hypothetical protein
MVDTATSIQPPARKRSVWQLLATLAGLLASLAALALALLAAGLTCDESCDDRSTLWRDNPDAWQWDGQFALAGLAALCALYALVAAVRGRGGAWPALGVSAVVWACWWSFLSW